MFGLSTCSRNNRKYHYPCSWITLVHRLFHQRSLMNPTCLSCSITYLYSNRRILSPLDWTGTQAVTLSCTKDYLCGKHEESTSWLMQHHKTLLLPSSPSLNSTVLSKQVSGEAKDCVAIRSIQCGQNPPCWWLPMGKQGIIIFYSEEAEKSCSIDVCGCCEPGIVSIMKRAYDGCMRLFLCSVDVPCDCEATVMPLILLFWCLGLIPSVICCCRNRWAKEATNTTGRVAFSHSHPDWVVLLHWYPWQHQDHVQPWPWVWPLQVASWGHDQVKYLRLLVLDDFWLGESRHR